MPFGWGSKDSAATPDAGLLDAFDRALPPDAASTGPALGWTDKDTRSLLGRDLSLFTLFMADHARSSVGDGLLRFLMPDTQPSLIAWNGRDGWRSDWPSAEPGIVFASDWTGRLYLLASGKRFRNGEPPVILVDPATAEVAVLEYASLETTLIGETDLFVDEELNVSWRPDSEE